MKAPKFDAGVITVGAGAAVLLAVGVAFSLGALSRPSDLSNRLSHVGETTARAERALKGRGDADAYPAGAVCRGPGDAAAEALGQRVQAAAASAGVTVSTMDAVPEVPQPDEPLATVRLEIAASGAYDATLMFLNLLARSQPEVFADTLDLETKGPQVELAFTGRLLCSTSARF